MSWRPKDWTLAFVDSAKKRGKVAKKNFKRRNGRIMPNKRSNPHTI